MTGNVATGDNWDQVQQFVPMIFHDYPGDMRLSFVLFLQRSLSHRRLIHRSLSLGMFSRMKSQLSSLMLTCFWAFPKCTNQSCFMCAIIH